MSIHWILGPELEQQDFRLYDEEDTVELWHEGKLVGTWYTSTATLDLIKQAARAWLKEREAEERRGNDNSGSLGD